ncbi:MAG: choice-of-anchor Q domain-containing protein [Chthoniobacteraceae bacterium]
MRTITPGIEFSINHDVTIDASNLDFAPNINGGGGWRIFVVSSNATLILHSLKLSGGKAAANGGAIANAGTITLTRCTLTGNHADAGDGGGIFNSGTATLTQCTLSGNFAGVFGGVFGGGICTSSGLTVLTHSTLSGNTAPAGNGSGVASFGNANTETVVQNCIISGNTNSSVDVPTDTGTINSFTSLGHNLIGPSTTTTAFNATGDINNNTPQLAALAENGGPTQTLALLPTSPARGAAAVLDPAITSDQRGFPIAGLPDIGAFEFPNTPSVAENTATTATTGDQKSITVSATDEDGIPPTIISTSGGTGLTVNSINGFDITFTPNANFVGGIQLFYQVGDGNGALASGEVIVSVADNAAPQISGTFSPRMVFAGTVPDFRGQATASDNIGVPTITQSPLQGSATTAGTVPVTLTATDTAGNTAETSFDLIVRPAAPVSTVLVAKGADAPGRMDLAELPDDAVIASFNTPATDDAGNVAFLAKWTSVTGPVKNGTGLFLNDKCLAVVGGDASAIGGTGAKWRCFSDPVVAGGVFLSNGAAGYTPLARVGDPAGTTGAKFSLLKDPVLAHDGGLAFPATISARGPAKATLWWKPPGQPLALLAQGGAPATEVPGAKWKAFTSLAIAAGRGPIFAATLSTRASGVWASDFTGTMRLLFRTGSPVAVGGKTVKSFKLLSATVGSTGVTRSFNDTAQVVWLATFADKTTAIVRTDVRTDVP